MRTSFHGDFLPMSDKPFERIFAIKAISHACGAINRLRIPGLLAMDKRLQNNNALQRLREKFNIYDYNCRAK